MDYSSRDQWQALYKTKEWKALRQQQLSREPLCKRCADQGQVVAASVADHIKAHKGDLTLFFDPDNLQSLCKPCHDSWKQSIERRGYSTDIGPDGWPVDPQHPCNR